MSRAGPDLGISSPYRPLCSNNSSSGSSSGRSTGAERWQVGCCRPHPNSLVVNVGDQIQALSNGRYRSVWHRAIVNSNEERISVASFLCPANDAVIAPAKELTSEESPAIYRSFTYDEYYRKIWSRDLDGEHCLELFK